MKCRDKSDVIDVKSWFLSFEVDDLDLESFGKKKKKKKKEINLEELEDALPEDKEVGHFAQNWRILI